jgi:hypothetical protein
VYAHKNTNSRLFDSESRSLNASWTRKDMPLISPDVHVAEPVHDWPTGRSLQLPQLYIIVVPSLLAGGAPLHVLMGGVGTGPVQLPGTIVPHSGLPAAFRMQGAV